VLIRQLKATIYEALIPGQDPPADQRFSRNGGEEGHSTLRSTSVACQFFTNPMRCAAGTNQRLCAAGSFASQFF